MPGSAPPGLDSLEQVSDLDVGETTRHPDQRESVLAERRPERGGGRRRRKERRVGDLDHDLGASLTRAATVASR